MPKSIAKYLENSNYYFSKYFSVKPFLNVILSLHWQQKAACERLGWIQVVSAEYVFLENNPKPPKPEKQSPAP